MDQLCWAPAGDRSGVAKERPKVRCGRPESRYKKAPGSDLEADAEAPEPVHCTNFRVNLCPESLFRSETSGRPSRLDFGARLKAAPIDLQRKPAGANWHVPHDRLRKRPRCSFMAGQLAEHFLHLRKWFRGALLCGAWRPLDGGGRGMTRTTPCQTARHDSAEAGQDAPHWPNATSSEATMTSCGRPPR